MEWMIMPYKRYADFSGRSRRREYWLFTLFYTVIFVVLLLGALAPVLAAADGGPPPEMGPVSVAFTLACIVFGLGSIIPGLAVTVRRFHDQDKSGWFILLNFIPYIGGIILLVMMCLEGTRGDNSYGPDPKDPGNAGVFD
jgi:uncharacterized membrane protein YhaH (DUF805 family)